MRTIIDLENQDTVSDFSYLVAMRFQVPAGHEFYYADKNATSAYRAPDGDTEIAAEIAALQAGQWVEKTVTVTLPRNRVTQDAFDPTDAENIKQYVKMKQSLPQARPKIVVQTSDADMKQARIDLYNTMAKEFAIQDQGVDIPHKLDRYGISFDGNAWSEGAIK